MTMATRNDEVYRASELAIRRIHTLIDQGRSEDDETNNLRQDAADVWHLLTDEQQQALRSLSQSFNNARTLKQRGTTVFASANGHTVTIYR
jgi:hypothetical protein